MNTNSVPAEAISLYNKAIEKTNRDDLLAALSIYKQALKIYPNFIEAYNNMGEIYSIMGNKELAISIYSKALSIKGNHKIFLNLGVEYYNSGNYELALKHFRDSIKEKNDFQEGYYYIGLTYYNLKIFTEAKKFLTIVVAKDPKHLKANYMLSHIYYEWKDYSKVIKCLETIKNTSENQGFINKYYGFCYYHLGRYDEAVTHLKNALQLQPGYSKFSSYMEELTYKNKMKEIKNIEDAIEDLEQMILKNKPKIKDITRLSMLYILKGENNKAEEIVADYKKSFLKN